MNKILIFVICSVLFCIPTAAQAVDGNRLYQLCQNNNLCTIWMSGYQEGSFIAYTSDKKDIMPCYPDNVTLQQKVDIVKIWLQNNPKLRHGPAGMVAHAALLEAFPCR